jgi:cyclohexanecarboxyl-CoA dehydrogenase
MSALDLFTASPEGLEGATAFAEKRSRTSPRTSSPLSGATATWTSRSPHAGRVPRPGPAVAAKLAPDYQARERAGRIEPELRREIGAAGLIAPELPVALGGQGATGSPRARHRGDRPRRHQRRLPAGGRVLVGQIIAGQRRTRGRRHWVPRICAARRSSGSGSPSRTRARTRACRGSPPSATATTGSQRQQVAVVRPRRRRGGRVRPHRPSRSAGKDISAFLVPLDLPGVTREPVPDMGTKAVGRGWRTCRRADPGDHLLGAEGRGFTQVMHGFDFSRALIGCSAWTARSRTVDETWRYVAHREAPSTAAGTTTRAWRSARRSRDAARRARLLCYRTLWLKDTAQPHTARRRCASGGRPRVAYDVVTASACLLHGQYGYRTELPIEQTACATARPADRRRNCADHEAGHLAAEARPRARALKRTPMGKLDNKIAIVTGAGQGIGRGHREKLAAEGATVAVTDINEATAKETAQAGRRGRHRVRRDLARGRRGDGRQVQQQFGRIDVL